MEREITFCYYLDIQIMEEGDVKLKPREYCSYTNLIL